MADILGIWAVALAVACALFVALSMALERR
jgi:hypothetical protein